MRSAFAWSQMGLLWCRWAVGPLGPQLSGTHWARTCSCLGCPHRLGLPCAKQLNYWTPVTCSCLDLGKLKGVARPLRVSLWQEVLTVAPSIGGPGALTELGEPLSCRVTHKHGPRPSSYLRTDFQPTFSSSN